MKTTGRSAWRDLAEYASGYAAPMVFSPSNNAVLLVCRAAAKTGSASSDRKTQRTRTSFRVDGEDSAGAAFRIVLATTASGNRDWRNLAEAPAIIIKARERIVARPLVGPVFVVRNAELGAPPDRRQPPLRTARRERVNNPTRTCTGFAARSSTGRLREAQTNQLIQG